MTVPLALVVVLDLLGPGATMRPRGSYLVLVGLPLLAVICGAVGLVRVKSADRRSRRRAIEGLCLGGLEACAFALALVVFLRHGDHIV